MVRPTNYRRQSTNPDGVFIIVWLIVFLIGIAFWCGVGFIVLHFLLKFW